MGIAQEECAVIGKVRVQQHIQQATLAGHHQLRNAADGLGLQLTVPDQPQATRPLGY
jgi:hypothetical protein